MGHFFKTQPNTNFLDPTHKSLHPADPTQSTIDTWYDILGYTENFIQQLLHVTDKFTVAARGPTLYSAWWLYILQANCQWKLLFSCSPH